MGGRDYLRQISFFWTINFVSGIIFGPSVTRMYTHANNLKYICRAHQVVREGYAWSQHGMCLTIFSAANYCSECRNLGAIMKLTRNNTRPTFKQYQGQTYPPSPDGRDAQSDLTTFNSKYMWQYEVLICLCIINSKDSYSQVICFIVYRVGQKSGTSWISFQGLWVWISNFAQYIRY